MELNKRLAKLNADGEQDAVARKVYLATLQEGVAAIAHSPKPDAIEAAPVPRETANVQPTPMVKDMILAIIRDAYPIGLTAAQIKGKAFLRFKQHINPNTLTVTLGRYSKPKDGEPKLVQCNGRTWFYLPPGGMVRSPDLLNGGRHAAE